MVLHRWVVKEIKSRMIIIIQKFAEIQAIIMRMSPLIKALTKHGLNVLWGFLFYLLTGLEDSFIRLVLPRVVLMNFGTYSIHESLLTWI